MLFPSPVALPVDNTIFALKIFDFRIEDLRIGNDLLHQDWELTYNGILSFVKLVLVAKKYRMKDESDVL